MTVGPWTLGQWCRGEEVKRGEGKGNSRGQETEGNWNKGTVVWEVGGQRDRDEVLKYCMGRETNRREP